MSSQRLTLSQGTAIVWRVRVRFLDSNVTAGCTSKTVSGAIAADRMSACTVPVRGLEPSLVQGFKVAVQDRCSPLTPFCLANAGSGDHEHSCDELDHQGGALPFIKLAASSFHPRADEVALNKVAVHHRRASAHDRCEAAS